jgi:hypothetical protein
VVSDDLTPDGRSDAERRFLGRLTVLQPPYCEVWTWALELIVTVTVADPDENLVLRTLRVDFGGLGFVAGNDPSGQITDDLDPEDPDRFESPGGLEPEELADIAMGWLREQANRPIDRQEWDENAGAWRRWVLADTGQALALRQADGVPFAAGGAWEKVSSPSGAPDRVVRISG